MNGPCCNHYSRGCLLLAPCCDDEAFACHVCHDEDAPCGSKLDRRSIQRLRCLKCSHDNPNTWMGYCVYCGADYGRKHACTVCHVYSHDKDMWHCDKCGICRLGEREQYRHCDTCDACLPTTHFATHTCAPNAMHRECLLCRGYLFTSRSQVAYLPGCGHLAIHLSCLQAADAEGSADRLVCPHCSEQRSEAASAHILNASASSSGGSGAGSSSGMGADDFQELEAVLAKLNLQGEEEEEEDGKEGFVLQSGRSVNPPSKVYFMDGTTCGTYLRRFNDLPNLVIPSDEENEASRKAVDRVARTLHALDEVSVDRVHKGGSFGRKTSVKGRFDVDLPVFANNLPADPASSADLMRQKLGVKEVQLKIEKNLLKFEADGVHMDVLLLHNLAKGQPAGVDKAQVHVAELVAPLLRMTDAKIAELAAAAPDGARERGVVESLTKFVGDQHTVANQAVRLFKAWVKCGLGERGLLSPPNLRSVALELIVLAAFQQEEQEQQKGGQQQRGWSAKGLPDVRESRMLLLRVFLRALDLSSRLLQPGVVVLLDARQYGGYSREQGMRFRGCWGADGPFIIHPIDPTCNVARAPGGSQDPWDWAGLARHARVLLSVVQHCSFEVLRRESTLGAALYRLEYGIGKQ
ncbi:hypothetical protein Agub_g3221 [Astrephomene gubernaculifera]|uniref:Zinc finger protein n=1 Tax=Astrephomene gubernaculifera TaxID=47775 RepID=A0AAD3DI71_9CHLO|nr:hypothetical protein Agub_g3221 [Astrephomene gubernaculifera]